MPRSDGIKNLKNFPKGVSPSPGGKPRFYTFLKKLVKAKNPDMSLSKKDLRETLVLLFDQPLSTLKDIATAQDSPAILVYLCSVIKKGITTGRIDLMKELFNSVFSDVTGADNEKVINFIVGFDVPTDEELNEANEKGEGVDNEQ